MLKIIKKSSKIGDRFTLVSDLHKNEKRALFQPGNRQLSPKFSEQFYCPHVPNIFSSHGTRILMLFRKQFLKISICIGKLNSFEIFMTLQRTFIFSSHCLRPRLHDTVFISYRIGFISDWPSVYTIPFSLHIGLASCLHENAPIRYASYRFRVFK